MFGGNQTERRQRRDRLWSALGFLAFFGLFWSTMASDARTEAIHMRIFWTCAVIAAPITSYAAWVYADAQPKRGPKTGTLTLAGIGILLSNLLENLRGVIGVIFGVGAGFSLGAAVALLAIVFLRPLLKDSSSTE